MGNIGIDAYRYSDTILIVFGILGNIVMIHSIRRPKINVLKSNYYFLVLHLAICDLAVLIIYFFGAVEFHWLEEPFSDDSPISTCLVSFILYAFRVAGVGMMLVISQLRYRVTVPPLKPAISQRKLKVICGLVYLVGVIVGGGTYLPECFIKSNDVRVIYEKYLLAFWIFFVYFLPTIFMAAVYYKIARSLMKQNKYIKRVCSNATRRRAPDSSVNILRYIRNRRTFLVCLTTVLCYGITHIPMSVWLMWIIAGKNHLRMKFHWVLYFANVLRAAGSHSANPLIYGILDKKFLTFWKCCHKKKQRTAENSTAVLTV